MFYNGKEYDIKIRYAPKSGLFWRLVNGKWKLIRSVNAYNYYRFSLSECKNGFVHRAIYELMTGKPIPKGLQIDHINGDRLDNRWINLRIVTHRQNHMNKIYHRDGHLLGTTKHGDRWRSYVRFKGKKKHIGVYDTQQEAHMSYVDFCKKHNIELLEVYHQYDGA